MATDWNAKHVRVEMPDGSRWDVPVMVIARSRAEFYKHEFDGDIERSLAEDTLPLFAQDDFDIFDWAANNMNWSDVKDVAKRAPDKKSKPVDFENGWTNGKKELVTL